VKTKEQQKSYLTEYYLNNKDRWKKYAKAPQTDEQKTSKKINKMKWKEDNPAKNLWSNAKYRATKDGIEFNIEISDLIIPKYCKYLNIELSSKKGNRRCDALMSIDRINSKLGYVKGNVEIISYKANRMKNDASIKELIIFSENVLKIYKDDKSNLP